MKLLKLGQKYYRFHVCSCANKPRIWGPAPDPLARSAPSALHERVDTVSQTLITSCPQQHLKRFAACGQCCLLKRKYTTFFCFFNQQSIENIIVHFQMANYRTPDFPRRICMVHISCLNNLYNFYFAQFLNYCIWFHVVRQHIKRHLKCADGGRRSCRCHLASSEHIRYYFPQ